MGFIEVRPEIRTGNKEIDAHHRHLIELFNLFFCQFKLRKHKNELGSLLEKLVDYATYHFHAEELWMSDCGYPDAEAHKKEHQSFSERLNQIQTDFASGRGAPSLETLSFLSRWMKSHIYGSDLRIARFAQGKAPKAKAA